MNIVDSSSWLAYFADEPNAKHFLTPLDDTDSLVVPTATIYELFESPARIKRYKQRCYAKRKGCGSNNFYGDYCLKNKSGAQDSNG